MTAKIDERLIRLVNKLDALNDCNESELLLEVVEENGFDTVTMMDDDGTGCILKATCGDVVFTGVYVYVYEGIVDVVWKGAENDAETPAEEKPLFLPFGGNAMLGGRIHKALTRQYNFYGRGIMSLEEYLTFRRGEIVGKKAEERTYSRREVCLEKPKLAKPIVEYYAVFEDRSMIGVPKIVYDILNTEVVK